MDYVKRRLEKVRQQGIEEKIQEAMTQPRMSQPATGDEAGSGPASIGTAYKVALFLLGLTAGAAVTAMAWWVATDAPAIESTGRNIDLLNRRVEQLGDEIAGLESGLTRLLELAESTANREQSEAAAVTDVIAEPAHAQTVPVAAPEVTAAEAAAETETGTETGEPVMVAPDEGLSPTHSVSSRLNLRPSASLDTIPVTVLPAGTQVEKISETGDWYYVDAGVHGKGWCFSDYLAPLL